jgi:RNA methyltransferase, TrmH family
MKRELITSRRNQLAQRARAVRDGRDRGRVFIEGVRLCEEALAAGLDFELILFTESLARDERGRRLVATLGRVCPELVPVTAPVLESVAETKTSQGIVAIAARPAPAADVLDAKGRLPLVVVMHRANNPSNAGAMLRVAEAAGATGAVATEGSTDPLSPKALRGSMGSAFRLPVLSGVDLAAFLGSCRARSFRVVAAAAGAVRTHAEFDWNVPCAVVVGPEAGGLTGEEAALADELISIPMRPPVESLNVATALAVLLYEAARQRRFQF